MSALRAFYGGPVWKEHRTAAASTMIDSDDVLLLRPAFEDAGLAHPPAPRPSTTDLDVPAATIVATIHSVAEPLSNARGPGLRRRVGRASSTRTERDHWRGT